MSRRPARETIAFAVALVALATLGGVAAASVASAAPAVQPAPTADGVADAEPVAAVAASAPNGSLDYDGDRLVVEQATDQRIAGTTSLENGSQVTIRVRSSGGANPFLRSAVATVGEDGSFATTMDFESIDRGTEFEVSVHYNGTELATAPGVVGGCDPTCGDSAGSASFAKNLYAGTAGEPVEIRVSMTDRDTATLRFGSDATNVRIPVTVTDGNDDGKVIVVLRTSVDELGDPGVYASADADSVRVHDDVDRPQSLSPGEYGVELYRDAGDPQHEGLDVATVVLNEPTADPATTRGGDAGTTTVGTIYGSATTAVTGPSGGFSLVTVGVLGLGGVLAILGVVALVGGLD